MALYLFINGATSAGAPFAPEYTHPEKGCGGQKKQTRGGELGFLFIFNHMNIKTQQFIILYVLKTRKYNYPTAPYL